MARRYGRLNNYDSPLRRCAISGLRYYESEMVRVSGLWIHPDFLDDDGPPRTGFQINAEPGLREMAPGQDWWEYNDDDDLMPRPGGFGSEAQANAISHFRSWTEAGSDCFTIRAGVPGSEIDPTPNGQLRGYFETVDSATVRPYTHLGK